MEHLITDELINATYLWCYKHLYDAADAEDLAHDILFEALSAIRRGTRIDSFYPWYWGLAQNRLRMHVRIKQTGAVCLDKVSGTLENCERVEDSLLAKEEISELNRAISRLSRLQREVIILYYLKNMKINEIAERLGVPVGTVKRRLHDAKNDIRKGMETMTNTSRSSYAPANIDFACGFQGYKLIEDLDILSKQILISCSKEAKSVGEIADELGVAAVYLEDKINVMKERNIMKTSGNKYLTNFCIYDAQLLTDLDDALHEEYKDIGKELTDIILQCEDEIRALDFYGNDLPMGRLAWILYIYVNTVFSDSAFRIYSRRWDNTIPENKGINWRTYGIVRYPDEELKRTTPIDFISWSNFHTSFKTSAYSHLEHANLFEKSPFGDRNNIITDSNADLFMRIYDDPTLKMTANEKETAAWLIKKGYLSKRNNGLYPTMPIMTYEVREQIHLILKNKCSDLAEKYAERIGNITENILLPHTRKDLLEQFVYWVQLLNFLPTGRCFHYALNAKDSILEIPEDYQDSSLAIALYYKK